MGRGAPVLESHHVDIAALALIAVGIFISGVAYAGWSGGALGGGAVTVLRFLFGALGYVVPAAFVAAGALVLLRELRPPTRPLRTGTICLTVALTLGARGRDLGIGPGAAPAGELWRAAALERRGGILGAAEYWVCSHLISHAGADILAVFLLVAGRSWSAAPVLAGALRMTGAHVANTGRALREVSGVRRGPDRRPQTGDRRRHERGRRAHPRTPLGSRRSGGGLRSARDRGLRRLGRDRRADGGARAGGRAGARGGRGGPRHRRS